MKDLVDSSFPLGRRFRLRNASRRGRNGFWHTVIIRFRPIVLLLVTTLAAFGVSLFGSFHFDDYSLFAGDIWHPFPTRPLTYASFWINQLFRARDPLPYHAVNLILHLASAVLVYIAIKELIDRKVALLASLIFAVHPLQAEAVNYIFARSTLLATFFCLLVLLFWIRGRLWLAAACYLLAVLAKEECAAFPIFLALLDYSKHGRICNWKPIAGMLAIAAAGTLRVALATRSTPGSGAGVQAGLSPIDYLLTQGTVILRYWRLMVFPFGLTVDPDIHVTSAAVGIAAWLLIIGVAGFTYKRYPNVGLWLVGGLLLLMPTSSLFPAADLAADRRMYLPMLGFATAAAILIKDIRPTAAVVLFVFLIAMSFERSLTWQTEETLWADAVTKAPDKARPKIQLARVSSPQRAFELLDDAEKLSPDNAAVASEKGRIYLSAGQPDLALTEFGRALALEPNSAEDLNNRGVALLVLRQPDAARQDFENALAKDPCQFNALLNLRRIGISEPLPSGCRFSASEREALIAASSPALQH